MNVKSLWLKIASIQMFQLQYNYNYIIVIVIELNYNCNCNWTQTWLLSQNLLWIVKACVWLCVCVITCRGTVTAYVEKACICTLKITTIPICDLMFGKGTLSCKIILITCLHLIAHKSTILYWKLMKFSI